MTNGKYYDHDKICAQLKSGINETFRQNGLLIYNTGSLISGEAWLKTSAVNLAPACGMQGFSYHFLHIATLALLCPATAGMLFVFLCTLWAAVLHGYFVPPRRSTATGCKALTCGSRRIGYVVTLYVFGSTRGWYDLCRACPDHRGDIEEL